MDLWSEYQLKLLLLLVLLLIILLLPPLVHWGKKRDADEEKSVFAHIRLPDGRMGDFRPVVQLHGSQQTTNISELNTHFSVYTQIACTYEIIFADQPVPIDVQSLVDSELDRTAPIIVVVPGYLSDDREEWADELASKWRLLNERVNVVVVTWEGGSKGVYEKVVERTPLVARQITIFLAYLADVSGTSMEDSAFLDRIQLVGHSLGAHIAGFVGQDLLGQAGRIVGLDPAGPMFDEMPKGHRLSRDDAKLVQVLHTNSGKMKYMHALASTPVEIIDMLARKIPWLERARRFFTPNYDGHVDSSWFGIDLQLGDLDYYANGGSTQVGCTDIMHICDHKRAHGIYVSLLDRQINLTRSLGAKRAFEASPMAFYADSHQQFLKEAAVQTRCFMGDLAYLGGCGAPLDLLGPPEDIIGLPLSGDKLFFETNGGHPLIGDQYLLQVGLAEKISWDESCALELNFTFAGNKWTNVEINKHLKAAENGVLAIPFVGPKTFEALVCPTEIAGTLGYLEGRLTDSIREALPSSFDIDISRSRATGLLEALWRKITQFFGYNKPSDICKLTIKSWKIRALVDRLGEKIVGIYVDTSAQPLSSLSSSHITVLQASKSPHATLQLTNLTAHLI